MKVFLEDISKQRPSDKLMQHRKRVHMFDRNGYGFELEKGQQSKKAENEVCHRTASGVSTGRKLMDSKKARMAEINFLL